MVLNSGFWSWHFSRLFAPQIRSLVDTLRDRLLPVFANIETEANEKSEEEYERLGSLPAREGIDMADLAEKAFEAGLAHYEMMSGLRQGLQNMFAAALYHLYEQQVMLFHRREVLDQGETSDARLFKLSVFRERLLRYGIDVQEFLCWNSIEELRLVANTVKHGEGNSAFELRTLRPDIFVSPYLTGTPLGKHSMSRVYQPVMGEDIYVSLDDLSRYAAAVQQFWEELSKAMETATHGPTTNSLREL